MAAKKAAPRKSVTQELFIELTPEEKAAKAKECTSRLSALAEREKEYRKYKLDTAKEHREERKAISQLSTEHESGTERREVKCEQVYDTKSQQTWYEYQGKQYSKRDMTEDEVEEASQPALFESATEGMAEAPF